MYYIESGKAAFCELLRRFEEQAVVLVQSEKPICVGILVAAQSGGLAISCEYELIDGRPKHGNPAEMDYSFVGDYGRETSPGREWSQASSSHDSLVTNTGVVIVAPRGSHVFSPPIFDAVCRWMEEFFERPEALFVPTWLVVDEVHAGLNRIWEQGTLRIL